MPQSWVSARSSRFSTALVFLPGQVILLRRLDGAVAQALGVVARHDPLHGGEEGLDEILLLVVEVLADALGHRDGGALQLQHAERDAVDVEHDVRALAVRLGVGRRDRDFLGDGEVVVLRMLPVDQPDGLRVLADLGLHLHAVAQQVVDRPVAVVEALAGVARRLVEHVQRPGDQRLVVALLLQPGTRSKLRLDVAVALAVGPVAEIVVAQLLAEQLHHALLGPLLSWPTVLIALASVFGVLGMPPWTMSALSCSCRVPG